MYQPAQVFGSFSEWVNDKLTDAGLNLARAAHGTLRVVARTPLADRPAARRRKLRRGVRSRCASLGVASPLRRNWHTPTPAQKAHDDFVAEAASRLLRERR